jgi:hypothetical protein
MAQPGEESFERVLQPGERGIAALRLDQAHQEASWAFGSLKCLQGQSDIQRVKIRGLDNGALPLNWIITCLLSGRHHSMDRSKSISNAGPLTLPGVSYKVKIG